MREGTLSHVPEQDTCRTGPDSPEWKRAPAGPFSLEEEGGFCPTDPQLTSSAMDYRLQKWHPGNAGVNT
ncbi:MAG: hypothetical protein Kow0056_10540 [Coriobacteriia bacterium]